MDYLDLEEYQKDKNRFFAITSFSHNDTSIVKTDNDSYIIMNTGYGNPTWIWTKDNMTNEQYNEVFKELNEFINNNGRFTSKKEFYEYIVRNNLDYFCDSDILELGFLQAYQLIKPKECDGKFRCTTMDDFDTLLDFFIKLMEEEGKIIKDIESSKERIKLEINNGLKYVWEDSNGKIVSQAEYRLINNSAKISGVYTPIEERRKGYCSNTMYELTKLLLDKGYEVFLFTDYNYVNSNEAYKKIGYIDEGYLVNYSLKRK